MKSHSASVSPLPCGTALIYKFYSFCQMNMLKPLISRGRHAANDHRRPQPPGFPARLVSGRRGTPEYVAARWPNARTILQVVGIGHTPRHGVADSELKREAPAHAQHRQRDDEQARKSPVHQATPVNRPRRWRSPELPQ